MRLIFVLHCYKYISILLFKYLYNLNVIFIIILIISIRLIWRVEFIKISSLEMCVGQCVGGVMTASVSCMLSVNYDKCQMWKFISDGSVYLKWDILDDWLIKDPHTFQMLSNSLCQTHVKAIKFIRVQSLGQCFANVNLIQGQNIQNALSSRVICSQQWYCFYLNQCWEKKDTLKSNA